VVKRNETRIFQRFRGSHESKKLRSRAPRTLQLDHRPQQPIPLPVIALISDACVTHPAAPARSRRQVSGSCVLHVLQRRAGGGAPCICMRPGRCAILPARRRSRITRRARQQRRALLRTPCSVRGRDSVLQWPSCARELTKRSHSARVTTLLVSSAMLVPRQPPCSTGTRARAAFGCGGQRARGVLEGCT